MKPQAENQAPIQTDAYSAWLRTTLDARRTGADVTVPCGDCRSCCTSGYFIHIAPDEHQVLSVIPRALLFAAPGLPLGHLVMGHDKHGHCPMFVGNACSIYASRPRVCRQYDCRVLAATKLSESDSRAKITQQAERWLFEFSGAEDNLALASVSKAVEFLERKAHLLPVGFLPSNQLQKAVLALEIHAIFAGQTQTNDDQIAARIVALIGANRQCSP